MRIERALLALALTLTGLPAAGAQGPASRLASQAGPRICDPYPPHEEDRMAAEWLRDHADREGPRLRANSHLLAGEPISIGPLYKATYDREGATFTPLLGRGAPRTRTMTYGFESARVGGTPILGLDRDVEPELKDGEVRFERGALREVYLAKDEGLEQLFVFDSLPSRDGDLVVRGSFSTDLAFVDGDGAQLLFREPDIATVRVGDVVGIDAAGRRVAGGLRWIDGSLELSLPASFVAEAELPLVLDPLLSVDTEVSANILNADQPDVAFGNSTPPRYAVVFCRYYSLLDPDITIGSYDPTGTELSSLFAVETSVGTFDQEPSIAYNVEQSTFGVAWTRSSTPTTLGTVRFATFNVELGTVSSTLTVASSLFGSAQSPDVGGEQALGFSRMLVAYEFSGSIRVASISLVGGTPAIVNNTAISTMSANCSHPAITQSGGTDGRYIVACEKQDPGQASVRFSLLGSFGSELGGATSVSTSGVTDSQVDVAGEDGEYLAVYTYNPSPGDGDRNIWVVQLIAEGNLLSIAWSAPLASDNGDDEHSPAVGFLDDRYLVAYVDEGNLFSGDTIWAVPVRPGIGPTCEPAGIISAGNGNNAVPRVGSQRAGGQIGTGRAMIAFARDLTLNSQVWFDLYENAPSSTFQNLGGGCGDSGNFSLNGDLSIGGDPFSARLSSLGLTPSVAVLNLGAPGGEFACGPCTALPLQTLITVPTSPGILVGQTASVQLAIPCKATLLGQTLAMQWIVLPTMESPCSLAANVSLSDRLELTLGY